MPELGPYGSVRGALSNERPYRDSGAPRSTHLRTKILSQGVGQDGAFEGVPTALDADACVIDLDDVDD
jgi:hypothetical protein